MELAHDKALWLYDRMVTIRAFEERVAKLCADGRIPGFVHLYAGEEAVAVGSAPTSRTRTSSPRPTAGTATASPRASSSAR
jgi:TPP-dependent pyruvate/acetoin dehydrogenase alpha subunit